MEGYASPQAAWKRALAERAEHLANYSTYRGSSKTLTLRSKQLAEPHPFNAATIPSLYDVALNWKARSTLLLSKR